MKAVVCRESLPIGHPDALLDSEWPEPTPGERDLIVDVKAISVNPVDCKIRRQVAPDGGQGKVLGWDAAGVVCAIGTAVSDYQIGDTVFYAGDLTRPGSNMARQAVDERIVGRMPSALTFAEAAAMPLTAITAWELAFDRLAVPVDDPQAIVLITGAAGGVGSILIQLLKARTQATVIATASRPESRAWVTEMGADHVLDHAGDLVAAYQALGLEMVSHVASLTHTDQHYEALIELMQPQGKFGLIDDPMDLDIKAFKRKSISLHWEFMYTRSLFSTSDMQAQQTLLNRVADLVDKGQLKTTMTAHLGSICAANLQRAHQQIEQRATIGKLVLEGFYE